MGTKYKYWITGLALVLSACSGKNLEPTQNEQNGLRDLNSFYDGKVDFSYGYSSGSDGEKNYVKIEVSNSNGVEKYRKIAEMPASNIAYLFYHKLKEERSEYDEIQSILIFTDGTREEYKYPLAQLGKAENRMKTVEKIVGIIGKKDFEMLKEMLDANSLAKDQDQLIGQMKALEENLGAVKEFVPYGFNVYTADNIDFVHIAGVVIRKGQSNEFSVDLELNSNNEKIYRIDYKL